jgi:pimeloyl-ACP methyl ester carboxylesterase
MINFLFKTTKKIIKSIIFLLLGGLIVLLTVFVIYLESRPDLRVWHKAELDTEFTAESGVAEFSEYIKLEEKLFQQLEKNVYAQIESEDRHLLNRFNHGSMSDPNGWNRNWNRTFELSHTAPTAGILLLHGMSDSPYSLRNIGLSLHDAGATVIGLRVPGHGTAPSGLVEMHWQDMTAAVRLAMNHLQKQVGSQPLYIIGYSNGSALAVYYALESLDNIKLPKAAGLVLVSPAIGVTKLAALAVWQGRLGHLLGLDKLAWNSIGLEYDPFKYNSFAVDATVSTAVLITGLFDKLPKGGHELVLFDINRLGEAPKFFTDDPRPYLKSMLDNPGLSYTLALVTNEKEDSRSVHVLRRKTGGTEVITMPLEATWPMGVHSMSHIALPFPKTDSLYGEYSMVEDSGLHLGKIAMRGERGVLKIPASAMLRLRWNPFYEYYEKRIFDFIGLEKP